MLVVGIMSHQDDMLFAKTDLGYTVNIARHGYQIALKVFVLLFNWLVQQLLVKLFFVTVKLISFNVLFVGWTPVVANYKAACVVNFISIITGIASGKMRVTLIDVMGFLKATETVVLLLIHDQLDFGVVSL